MVPSHRLSVLLERLSRVLQNEAHAGGLKPTQWEVLRYLDRANRFSRTPSGMTAYLGMTKGTVSQTLNALERKGLVRKTADAADKRLVHLDLTRDGARMLASDPLESILKAETSATTALERQLEALLGDLLRRRGGRPFGVCNTCRFFSENAPDGSPHRCTLLNAALSDDDSRRICVEQEPAA